MRQPADDRRFLAMLGLSMAIHLVVLGWSRDPASLPRETLAAIAATLRPAPSVESRTITEPAHSAPLPVLKKSRQPAPSRELRPEPAVAAAGALPVAGEAAPSRSVPAAIPQSPIPPVATEAAVPLVDQAALVDGYGHRLSDLLGRQQEYPRLAALRGWEGEVRLRLTVARKGNLVAVRLERSSGFDVLDRHALQFLEQLRDLPPFPEGMEAAEIQVVVPLSYRLRRAS